MTGTVHRPMELADLEMIRTEPGRREFDLVAKICAHRVVGVEIKDSAAPPTTTSDPFSGCATNSANALSVARFSTPTLPCARLSTASPPPCLHSLVLRLSGGGQMQHCDLSPITAHASVPSREFERGALFRSSVEPSSLPSRLAGESDCP